MELNEKIYKLRKRFKLSLKEFGQIIDVSDVAVLKWEKGITEPKASNLKAIANNYGISVDELLETEPKINEKLLPTTGFNIKIDKINGVINNGTTITNNFNNLKN